MGSASHWLAGSYIEVHAMVPADELLGLSETIALRVLKRRAGSVRVDSGESG